MNSLYVFTSQRQVREFTAKFQNSLVPKAFSLGEFERRATYVPGLMEADGAQTLLLMREACKMCEAANTRLKIPTEFFAFLKNNDYLFSFFKELATQKKSVIELKFSDIYASFEEHIEILGEVLANYKSLLQKHGLYDEITFCELYELNESYLHSFDVIRLEVFGLLSEHEWELLARVAAVTTLKIEFQSSKFNRKLTDRIAQIVGMQADEIAPYFRYELNLTTKELARLEKLPQNHTILTRSFSLRSLQAAYVFEKISTFVRDGIAPENIAVVLPDESFASELGLYDDAKMLSYAMGVPFETTQFYALLAAMSEAAKHGTRIRLGENVLKESDLRSEESFLNFCALSTDLFTKFTDRYELGVKFEEFEAIVWEIFALARQENISEILQEELFFTRNLACHEGLKFGELVQILLLRLRARSIDETHGGVVRCIGVLESRGLKFDGVIIVDFNDDVVPKRSVNEMFLSSAVREKAGLISYKERENLQRFYYESLINGARRVAVSFVSDENKIKSRFLSEFDCVPDAQYSDEEYLGVFAGGVRAKFYQMPVVQKHDFFGRALSFSRLNTFLTCPRKYFYAYVAGLGEGRNFDKTNAGEYGKAIHAALFECYSRFGVFKFEEFLQILASKNLNALELEIARINFEKYAQNESEWAAQGWHAVELEVEKDVKFEGVALAGRIDRLDEREHGRELCVIDYKTGSNFSSLQLAFYMAIMGAQRAYFCDLKDKMAIDMSKTGDLGELREAIAQAREYFSGEVKFEPNLGAACRLCAYSAICTGQLR